jgi:hypothetical protein
MLEQSLPMVVRFTTIAGGNMKAFQETTRDWKTPVSNHIYYLTDDKQSMIAFYNVDTKVVKKFIKPIRFDTKYRTFKELK